MKTFEQLGVAEHILPVLATLGYETPSPIQERCIPTLLQGQDVLAQAQTGSGKTAAFALPILTQLKSKQTKPQALVLTPTRELAIQVAQAFQTYAKSIPGFRALPIYGGQEYRGQLSALKRGVHVVVGTPGRIMDHLRRGTLDLSALTTVVLDEADEMLKMGFIDDVKWILQQVAGTPQTALFSATMPASIREVSNQYLKDASHIQLTSKAEKPSTIQQSCMLVAKNHKMEALTRYLEIESFDATLIFSATKSFATELAEKLAARGYASAALHGDMNQRQRELVIRRLKNKELNIVVATDVAARGLDIGRISHVINYDIPYDGESYTHRIGRTGRAGREGKALLLVTSGEQRMLRFIERSQQQKIEFIEPPSVDQINQKRSEKFTAKVAKALFAKGHKQCNATVAAILEQQQCTERELATALVYMLQEGMPLLTERDAIAKNVFKAADRPFKRRGKDNAGRRRPKFGGKDFKGTKDFRGTKVRKTKPRKQRA